MNISLTISPGCDGGKFLCKGKPPVPEMQKNSVEMGEWINWKEDLNQTIDVLGKYFF